ncbi:hypothetical protein [Georgenia sp. Z1491]|uniref:hypothetical protein n=1 Tax=Georgenia sp. Z1491 TaxID=3416707 RepID=UPI003CEFCA8D
MHVNATPTRSTPEAAGTVPMLDTAATTLGLDPADLEARLAGGATLGEIAHDEGVAGSELVDALLVDIETLLDDEVADGTLSQDEADARVDEIADHVDALVADGATEDAAPPVGRPGGR